MKKKKNILIGLITIALISSCSSENEAKIWVTLETMTTFPDGKKLCYCSEAEYMDDASVTYGYVRASEAVEYYYWKGRKCKEFGYIQDGNSFIGPQNGSEPGPDGYFGSGAN